MSEHDEQAKERGEMAGGSPRSEAQTDANEQASSEKFAQAAGGGAGADEGIPPAGDVRTVYENERGPGEATPTKR